MPLMATPGKPLTSTPECPSADLDTQALALLLLQQDDQTNQLIPKLAAYVAQQQASPAGVLVAFGPIVPLSPSPYAVAIAASALSSYDVSSGSATPSLMLAAAIGSDVLLQVWETGAMHRASFRGTIRAHFRGGKCTDQ